MSLLAPLFLLGLGMIALPLWLHRLQTQSPEREPFSSAMLLSPSEQRTLLRRKLRYLLLLALRIALLALLALAFARPILPRTGASLLNPDAVLHLVIVDTSLSMDRGERFEEARAAVRSLVDGMEPGDTMEIVSAADELQGIAGPTGDAGALRNALALLRPGPGRLDFGVMMAGAGNLIRDASRDVIIHVISDFQNTGLPARFTDLLPEPIPGGSIRLDLLAVGEPAPANWAVSYLRHTAAGLEAGVRSWNTEPGDQRVSLRINGADQGEQVITVPAGGLGVAQFGSVGLERGDNRIEAAIAPVDGLTGDDRYYAVVENAPPAPVLLITREPSSRPVTYLTTALELAGSGYGIEPVTPADLDPRILARYAWVVVDDLGVVDEPLSTALAAYLEEGGALFAAAGPQAAARNILPVSGQRSSAALHRYDEYHAVARIDNSHPVLAGTAGWRSISVNRYITVEPDDQDRVLITLDNGSPLLVERTPGRGRLLLLTTSLDNTWSDLPVQPVFVGFMAQAARYLADEELTERQQIAGTSLTLRQSGYASGQIIDPQGRQVLSLADTQQAQTIRLNQTGYYEAYTPARDYTLAVNPDLRESDTTRMPESTLDRWRSTVIQPPVEAGTSAAGDRELPPLELWHTILIVLVLLALAEAVLGNRQLRLQTEAGE